jgi:FkbM family methyltransferase
MLGIKKKPASRLPLKTQSFRRLKEMGVPVNTVIDVGVLSCTEALMHEYRDRLHVLVEPIEEFAPRIKEIYDKYGVRHDLVIAAASDRDGEVAMQTKSVMEGTAITHARIVNEDAGGRKVKAMTLDTLVREGGYEGPFLLKIDVDGAELEILKGARPVLDQCSVVCVEVDIKNIVQRADFIVRAGFQPFDIVDLCYYDRRLAQADMVFVNTRIIKDMNLEIYSDGFDIEKWEAYEPR